MPILTEILVVLVAVLHLYFVILEMFLWTKPKGLKTFRMTAEKAKETAVLAANQYHQSTGGMKEALKGLALKNS